MVSANDVAIFIGFTLTILALIITFLNFRHIYRRLALTIIGSYFLLFLWASDLFFIVNVHGIALARLLTIISVLLLSSAIFFLHNFYDELSASYRQRKTMTLGSLLYGLVLGSISVPEFIQLAPQREILTNPVVASLILGQAALAIYRIIRHFNHQASLSEYYGISSAINSEKIRYIKLAYAVLLIFGLMLGVARPVFGWLIGLADPFILVNPIAFLLLAVLSYYDPISSLPVAQRINIAALIDFESPNNRLEYVFSSTFATKGTELNDFIRDIQSLIQELIQSSSSVRSIATHDVFVMFETCDNKLLMLIMERPSNLIAALLKRTAAALKEFQVISPQDFAKIIEANIIYS